MVESKLPCFTGTHGTPVHYIIHLRPQHRAACLFDGEICGECVLREFSMRDEDPAADCADTLRAAGAHRIESFDGTGAIAGCS